MCERLIRFWYKILNLRPLPCAKLGYVCGWEYPYGWTPEDGCPYHD
jgi:hypothetical protein